MTIQTLVYQFIMLLSSFYFGMLFTNWGYLIFDDGSVEIDYISSDTTFAIKMVALVLSVVLYSVSISLNICCPDRIL